MSYIWVYPDNCDRWHVLNPRDQKALNDVYREDSTATVPILGGRFDACVQSRSIKSVYSEIPAEVPLVRGSWFVNGVPYSEEDAVKISTFAASAIAESTPLQLKHRQIFKDSAGNLMESAGIILMPAMPLSRVVNGDFTDPRVLKDIDDDDTEAYTHLILCVHGIGESLWSKKAFNFLPFEEGCTCFRQLLSEFGKGGNSKIEVLPIEWFHIFSNSDCAKRIADITLPTVPMIRQFANGALSDVIFYLDPVHKQRVLKHIANRIAEILVIFRLRNPDFRGKISMIGHSLGSVICYDLLSSDVLNEDIIVDNLFLFGSPLSMFLTARNHPQVIPLKRSSCIYNVFQPQDPVAYRIEPLINPLLRTVEPAWIPSHLTGGILTQTKFRQATSSLWNIFAKNDGDEVKVPLTVRLQRAITGTSAASTDARIDKAVEDVVGHNRKERIDWSVQVGFAPTEYATAISAHVSYFGDRDIAKFVSTRTS